jgi:hypothetical protein
MTYSKPRHSTTKALTAVGLVLALQGIGMQSASADGQDDARALLEHSAVVTPPPVKNASYRPASIPDAQEQARRLLARSSGGVIVTGEPLVMRLNNDEFRIAFGLEDKDHQPVTRKGSVHYRIDWRDGDGITHSDLRQVRYTLAPDTARTIAVDRQYLDTAEGANTSEVLKVSVDAVSRE